MRSSSVKLVRATTLVPGHEARICRVASTPEMPGITRSMSTTSGRSSRHSRTASSPSPACPASSMSSNMPSTTSRPLRTST